MPVKTQNNVIRCMYMNSMMLVLGDWSEDGHSLSDDFGCRANKTVKQIQDAYKASCKLTGISFNHNEDYTELNRHWRIENSYRIATEYDSPFMHYNCFEVLQEFNCPHLDRFEIRQHNFDQVYHFEFDDIFKHYIDLWWWFVTLSLPDLEYKMAIDFSPSDPDLGRDIPPINGYWNRGLNVQFGYGLYEL